uniref:Uncharacterized protein n=1 Tax=Corethron hystrix TaxID=216773 RepID=A0A7S1FMA6_9STRA|mmetsp:Transcript_13227/g.29149  ORF Transcript_13227/g.29149 Transcript_13227/m.29149 type:complete len:246 (+) Transcript_13227:78-815(+)
MMQRHSLLSVLMVFGAFLCPGAKFFTSGYIVGPHRHSGRSSNQLSRQSRLHYPSPFFTPATTSALSLSRNTDTGEGSGNIFETLFTGGYGASEEDIAAAARIATKIRSASDLPGWEKAPMRRKGSTRPRHRAWGGDSELPVQEKPNYDPALEACPEKWLTQSCTYRFMSTTEERAWSLRSHASQPIFISHFLSQHLSRGILFTHSNKNMTHKGRIRSKISSDGHSIRHFVRVTCRSKQICRAGRM